MITVLSAVGNRRAIVTEDDDGTVIRYERADVRTGVAAWRFDHEARPALPFHAALDVAHAVVNR